MSNFKPKKGLQVSPNKGLKKKDFSLAEGNTGNYASKLCKNYTLSEIERRQLQEVSDRMWKAYDKKATKKDKQTAVIDLPQGAKVG